MLTKKTEFLLRPASGGPQGKKAETLTKRLEGKKKVN